MDRGRIRPPSTSESGPVGASRSPSDAQNGPLSVFGVYKAMVLGATLVENNNLYCSSPMKGGVDNQLFKATIHKDGTTHVYLPDRNPTPQMAS